MPGDERSCRWRTDKGLSDSRGSSNLLCSMTRASSTLYFASSLQLRSEPVAPRRRLFLLQPPFSAFASPLYDFVTRVVSLSRDIRAFYVRMELECCWLNGVGCFRRNFPRNVHSRSFHSREMTKNADESH